MAIVKGPENLLKENNIRYKVVTHPEVYTAQEIAATMHVPGKNMAKSVMIKAKDRFIMAVLPASWRVDFNKLKEVLKEKELKLASEDKFKGLFPDCEPGAEPPFGNLYNITTIVDKSLAEDEYISFNAGTHYEAVEMSYQDYANLVKPTVTDFAVRL